MRYLFDVVLHIADIDTARRALEQNQSAVLHKRKSREQNHNGDAHADARIGVEPSLVVGLPDHQRGNNDADVVERIPDDMNQHAEHSKISAGGREVGNCMTVLGVGAKRLQSRFISLCPCVSCTNAGPPYRQFMIMAMAGPIGLKDRVGIRYMHLFVFVGMIVGMVVDMFLVVLVAVLVAISMAVAVIVTMML